jgi:hypothetical protein
MAGNTVNEAGNQGGSVTISLPATVRDLVKLRDKYGATSAIGYRCTNILELLKYRGVEGGLTRQMNDLKRLLGQ